jgi:post-segregation antitoxin (ccd killing protein)
MLPLLTEIVIVKVRKSLKDKARKYKIDFSKTVRSVLEDEIRKREEQELTLSSQLHMTIIQKISTRKS